MNTFFPKGLGLKNKAQTTVFSKDIPHRERSGRVESNEFSGEKNSLRAFEPIESEVLAEELMIRLRRRIYQRLDQELLPCHREYGRLASGHAYFFIQPFNAKGFLFECQNTGWLVTEAFKIYGQETFIREGECLDKVIILLANDRRPKEQMTVRVISTLFHEHHLALSLYEVKLIDLLVEKISQWVAFQGGEAPRMRVDG